MNLDSLPAHLVQRIAQFVNPPYVEGELLFYCFVLDLAFFSQTSVDIHSALSQYLQDVVETICRALMGGGFVAKCNL